MCNITSLSHWFTDHVIWFGLGDPIFDRNSQGKSIYPHIYKWFELGIFFLLDRLSYQGQRTEPTLKMYSWMQYSSVYDLTKVLELRGMQTTLFRIWTQKADFTFLDDNRYATLK